MGTRGQAGMPGGAPGGRATLRDVAERAGVSISTASLVFSGKGPVSAPTVARVQAAAADLGFSGPNPLASSLRHGRAGVVGVLVEGRLLHAFRDPYAVQVLDGLAQVLGEVPTGMLLVADSDEQDDNHSATVAHLSGLALDAVVFSLCGESHNPVVDHLAARGIPMVGTGSPADPRVTHVLVDDRAAMRSVAQHLHDLGHRRVATVTMPLRPQLPTGVAETAEVAANDVPETRNRGLGVLDVFPDALVVNASRADVEHGAAAATAVLRLPPDQRPTAVLAQSDLLAGGVVRAAEDLGLRVPEDVSVTGFDGVSLPWLGHTLTTVDQHGEAKGRAVGELTRAFLEGHHPGDVTMPWDLRVGTTTGPAPR